MRRWPMTATATAVGMETGTETETETETGMGMETEMEFVVALRIPPAASAHPSAPMDATGILATYAA